MKKPVPVLLALCLFMVAIVAVTFVYARHSRETYHQEKAECEAKGRFYWRGNCLPAECSVVQP